MISLILRGKLPVFEDALTAAFFDAFRFTRNIKLLNHILSYARPFEGHHPLPTFDDFDVNLWPDLGGREPDARLELRSEGRIICQLIVEVKLGADKSGFGAIENDARSGDQLAYYFLAAVRSFTDTPCTLLYITHHGAMPRDSLHESSKELIRHGRGTDTSRFFWLSWRDVHEVLASETSLSLPLIEVCQFLERVKMFRFSSIRTQNAIGSLGSSRFYNSLNQQSKQAEIKNPDQKPPPSSVHDRTYKWFTAPEISSNNRFYKGRT